jgi:hypothetical protein
MALLTTAQVAAELQVHPKRVLRLIREGDLLASNVGTPVTHGVRRGVRARRAAVRLPRGVAMAGAQEVDQLRSAVEFRDLIGQAKGILIERFKISGDQAFQVLTRVSQHSNRKLRDIAAELVERGTVPQLPP